MLYSFYFLVCFCAAVNCCHDWYMRVVVSVFLLKVLCYLFVYHNNFRKLVSEVQLIIDPDGWQILKASTLKKQKDIALT